MAGQYQMHTRSGYLLSDVISALQKTIRRGEEELAIFFAWELVPDYEKYLWRRLVIIAHEDVGIASPDVLVQVQACKTSYFELRAEKAEDSAVLMVINAVLLMCRAKKTRMADHLLTVIGQRREKDGWKPEIPDYALDKHTAKGKNLGRDIHHFYDVAAVVVPEDTSPEFTKYEQECLKYEFSKPVPVPWKWPWLEQMKANKAGSGDEQPAPAPVPVTARPTSTIKKPDAKEIARQAELFVGTDKNGKDIPF